MLPKLTAAGEKKVDPESIPETDKTVLIDSTSRKKRSPCRCVLLFGALVAFIILAALIMAFLLVPRSLSIQVVGISQANGIPVDVKRTSTNAPNYSFNFEMTLVVNNPNYFDVTWNSVDLNASFPTPTVDMPPQLGSAHLSSPQLFPRRQNTTFTLPFHVSYDLSDVNSPSSRAYTELLFACGLFGQQLEHRLRVDWSATVTSKWLSFGGADSFSGDVNSTCPIDAQVLMKLPVPSGFAMPLPVDTGNSNSSSYNSFAG